LRAVQNTTGMMTAHYCLRQIALMRAAMRARAGCACIRAIPIARFHA